MFRVEWNRSALVRVGLILVFGISGLCVLAAVAVSRRCSGDGTFPPSDPMAHPSGYCRATGLATFPDTAAKTALVCCLFAFPAAIALVGTLLSVMRHESQILARSAMIAACGVALLFGSVLLADVSFSGYG
ncbi:MAG: hypothetical protein QOE65_2019 [Solirubrobacteraceae bacterium]|jgi:hypothetical protein|nr:hypothetical protein [Solirubrobacteraceae bacterium]